jgi:hypothetical protein
MRLCRLLLAFGFAFPDAAFRSAHPLHSCARDTDQLVELALFGIPGAAAQKNPVVN